MKAKLFCNKAHKFEAYSMDKKTFLFYFYPLLVFFVTRIIELLSKCFGIRIETASILWGVLAQEKRLIP